MQSTGRQCNASVRAIHLILGVTAGVLLSGGIVLSAAETAAKATSGAPIRLEEYLRRVWEKNENVQIRALEAAASDERWRAEKGIFEPEFTASGEAADRRRPNTTEQAVNSSFSRVFNERSQTIQTGFESLVPTGARWRLGYSVQHMENNFHNQPPVSIFGTPLAVLQNGEYLTTFGLTLTQPLLKNAGVKFTLAGIRMAAIQSDITFQTYRKGLMEMMVRAEAAYWELHQTQQQLAIASESLRVAQTLLTDNRKRLEVGKGTELDVLQAEAGVATRLALENEARQRLRDAQGKVATFLSEAWTKDPTDFRTVDAPPIGGPTPQFSELWPSAFELNPDYVAAIKQAELEGVRVYAAKNQQLPQLDLKGGFGLSRVGSNAEQSINTFERQDFPNWSIGLELRVPLGGGIKSRHESKAAQLRLEATRRTLENLGTQLANGVQTSIFSVRSYQENTPRYDQVVAANQEVLKNQLARLDAGKTDSRTVLQAEEDLFRAKVTSLENTLRYLRAKLELENVVGVALKKRNLDLTREELQQRTEVLTRKGKITPERYEQFLQDMKSEYERRQAGGSSKGVAQP